MDTYYKLVFIPSEKDIAYGVVRREELYPSLSLCYSLGKSYISAQDGRSYEVYSFTASDYAIITT